MTSISHLNRHQAAAVSRLFSAAVVRELSATGRSARFSHLAKLAGAQPSTEMTIGEFYDESLHRLSLSDYRDEYVYKTAIVRRILLGRHSLRSATALSEFRVEGRKIDLAILNGTSTAYEIKSERDSLDRVAGQVAAYSSVFRRVVVVAAERHVERLLTALPISVGLLTLNQRFSLSEVRKPVESLDSIKSEAICDSLRRDEIIAILTACGFDIPQLPNTLIGAALRKQFGQLTPEAAHDGMLTTLRRTRDQAGLQSQVDRLPKALHAALLTRKAEVGTSNPERLRVALESPMTTALKWG